MSVGAVNKQTGDRIPTAGMPAVDSVLSGTSTNPVQNKVVKEAFDSKQDTLTFDDTPTDGSNNPVKSNGVYDSEKDIYAAMGEMGAKNLFNPQYSVPRTNAETTATLGDDGHIIINGTANDIGAQLYKSVKAILPIYGSKVGDKLILSYKVISGTFTHGSSSNATTLYLDNKNGIAVSPMNLPLSLSAGDSDSKEITLTDKCFTDGILDLKGIQIFMQSGDTFNNLELAIMLRLASDTDDTYQPYAKTNKQLTDDVALLDSGKANTDMVAADFNAGTSYTAGNYCIYEGKFYKFKASHSGAWSASDVDEIKIAGELDALKSGLTDVNSNITNKSNLKIVQKGTASTSIVALYQETTAGEEVTYNVDTSNNLSDYPSDLISVGAIYYPQVNIKNYNSAYGFIMIQAAVVDGTPKVIFGYYNNGTCQWGNVI